MDEGLDSATHASALLTSAALRETVIIAEAQRRRVQTVALILDNGSTHAPKQLPLWVKELATRSDGTLTMQLSWLPTNARLS